MSLRSLVAFRAAILVSILLSLPPPARAMDLDGWVEQKGHGVVALSHTAQHYDQFWVGTTEVSDPMIGKVTTTSETLWFDYGITDRVTIIANLPYIKADSDGTAGFGQSQLQDVTVMGKYLFASVGSRVQSRFIGAVGFRTPASNYEIQGSVVDIGDGTNDSLFRFVYQLRAAPFFFSQQVGYDLRGSPAPDGRPFYTEAGLTSRWVSGAVFYSRYTARGGSDIGDPRPFPSNKEESTRNGLRLYGRFTGALGWSAMYFNTISGRNTGDATGVAAGIFYRFNK